MPTFAISPIIYLIVGAIFTIVVAAGGYKAGSAVTALNYEQARAGEVDKLVVHQQVVIKEVPKIVAKYIQTTTTVETETTHVITKVPDLLAADCLMPSQFGQLLVAAANGVDPDNGPEFAKYAGEYGCREVLKATLLDLKSGWKNTAHLEAVEQYVSVLTKGE